MRRSLVLRRITTTGRDLPADTLARINIKIIRKIIRKTAEETIDIFFKFFIFCTYF